MLKIKITDEATEKDLLEIKNWASFAKTNWQTINNSFKKKSLIVAKSDEKVVSFYSLFFFDIEIRIELAETKVEYRRRKIAQELLNFIINKYINSQFYFFKVHCKPKNSETFWKKMGFEYFDKNIKEHNSDEIYMYKIFKETLLELYDNQPNENDEIFEVWNNQYGNGETKWKWKPEFEKNTRKLIKPILIVGDYNWFVRLRKGNMELKDNFNYFLKNIKTYDAILVESLPEI